ncbi:MAG: hypothetical protein WKF43_06560 [Acidimicrobiales bacterium]
MAGPTFFIETLGCPKNQVDSDKLVGTLVADGMASVDDAALADLVVVNTCAFIGEARQESIDTVLALADARRDGARLVVTGCMAERYGAELAEALPEADAVAGFGVALGVPVAIGARPSPGLPSFDLLNLPRPPASAPWAYVKVAEGCDRACGSAPSPPSGQAAVPFDGVDPGRDRRARAAEWCSWPRTWLRTKRPGSGERPLALVEPRPARSSGAPAVPVPLRPHRRAGRRGVCHGCRLFRPVAPARVPAAHASHAALGDGRRFLDRIPHSGP